ncbi:hypothetical protein Tco_0794484 [Tanacetum coccineum]
MIVESVEVLIDDFSVFGNSFDNCLHNLDKMLKRCKDASLVLNWEKCHFMVKEGIVLEHKVSRVGLEVDKAKIDIISKLPPPLMLVAIDGLDEMERGYQGLCLDEFGVLQSGIPPYQSTSCSESSIMGRTLSPDRIFDFPIDEPEPHPAYDFFAPGPLPGYAGNPNNNNGWIKADEYLLEELEAMADEPMIGPIIDEVAKPVAEVEVEQVIAPVVDMDDYIAMLFGDDEFEDDASEGFDEDEHLDLPDYFNSIEYRMGNPEYDMAVGEKVMASQMVHAADSFAYSSGIKGFADSAAAYYGY